VEVVFENSAAIWRRHRRAEWSKPTSHVATLAWNWV
jgi:hypothetical protein